MLNTLKPLQKSSVPLQEKKFSFGQLPGIKPIKSLPQLPPQGVKPQKKPVPNGHYDYFMNSFASVQKQGESVPPLTIEPADSPAELAAESKKSRE